MLSAQQVIDAIHGSYATGSKHGFRNTRAMTQALVQGTLPPVIHVAGTNGKGSTCAMLESVLRHAGYRTGLYTSPFLQAYHERIRLDGLPISDALLAKYGTPLVEVAEQLQQQDAFVTPFEMGTALALSVFAGEKVDFAIVEVGMGGAKDPTNIVEPILCAIAAIGLDHMGFLGDTLPRIAGEKAGIIKPNTPVVCHPAAADVAAVFADKAREMNAPLRQLKQEMLLSAETSFCGSTATYRLENRWENIMINLPGAHQLTNAMTVLALVEELRKQGYAIPDEAVREGVASTVWPARLEWSGRVLIDGAHNPQGVKALSEYVRAHLADNPRVLLSGVLADKLQPEMLGLMASLADRAVTVTPDNPRALSAEDYAAALAQQGMAARAAASLEEGLQAALDLAGADGVVIAAGSLYFAGSLRTALGLTWR